MRNSLILKILLGVVGFVAVAPVSEAEIGTIDSVPAATLLLPRFEVDLGDSMGMDTLFSVNNASAQPALAHVTLWTEFSIPVLDFDIYLSGYDVQTLSLRNILEHGILPQTGSGVSNLGPLSVGGDFPGCNTGTEGPVGPVYEALSPAFVRLLQEELSGRPLSLGASAGLCTSLAVDPNFARGYITIDSVSRCSLEFPASAGYFSDGGVGVANNRNVLWGDYYYISRHAEQARGNALVSIEASHPELASPASCDGASTQTFYCRYTAADGAPGADNREALGSRFAVRYLNGGDFEGGGSVIVWRDSDGPSVPVACGSAPFRLEQTSITVFDEAENPLTMVTGGPSGLPPAELETPFPFETNRAIIGEDLTVEALAGWFLFDLGEIVAGSGEHHQAWVTIVMDAFESDWSAAFAVGFDAIQLDNLTRQP